jgi:hypothetical protein
MSSKPSSPDKTKTKDNGKDKKKSTRGKSKDRKDDSGDEKTYFFLKTSKSGRAKCKKCHRYINKEEVRVGTKHSPEEKASYVWSHIRCCEDLLSEDLGSLPGYGDLDGPQRKSLQDTVIRRREKTWTTSR